MSRRAAVWAAFEATLAGAVIGVVLAPTVGLVALVLLGVVACAAQVLR